MFRSVFSASKQETSTRGSTQSPTSCWLLHHPNESYPFPWNGRRHGKSNLPIFPPLYHSLRLRATTEPNKNLSFEKTTAKAFFPKPPLLFWVEHDELCYFEMGGGISGWWNIPPLKAPHECFSSITQHYTVEAETQRKIERGKIMVLTKLGVGGGVEGAWRSSSASSSPQRVEAISAGFGVVLCSATE